MSFAQKVLISIICIVCTISAQEFDDFTFVERVNVEKTSKAQQPIEAWTFEIENNTDQPLYTQLFYDDSDQRILPAGQGMISAKQGSKAGYLRAYGINSRRAITMYVWWKKDDREVGRQVDLGRLLEAEDRKDYRANRKYNFEENPHRRSIFLTWNKGEPKLSPNKGSGLWGKKTDSGITIKNNITPTEIQKTILSSDS